MYVLDRYIITEQVKIFLLATFVLFSVLALEKVNFLSNLLLTQHAPFSAVVKLALYISPTFLTLATPLAVLMSTLLLYSRLSADNEITAMRAGGVSMRRLMTPPLLLAIVAAAATLYLTVNLTHRGALAFRATVIEILQTSFQLDVREGRFIDTVPGLVMRVERSDGDSLGGVFIADQRQPGPPTIIEARRGFLSTNPGRGMVNMILYEGMIHSTTETGAYRVIAFDLYTLGFDLSKKLDEPLEKEIPHLSLEELKARIAELESKGEPADAERVALYKKYSIPLGCLALAILGVPVGIMTHKRGSAGGFGVGVLLIVLNYVLLMVGEGLGAGGKIPPEAAMWGPNIFLLALGAYLVARVSRDTMPTRLEIWLAEAWRWLRRDIQEPRHD